MNLGSAATTYNPACWSEPLVEAAVAIEELLRGSKGCVMQLFGALN